MAEKINSENPHSMINIGKIIFFGFGILCIIGSLFFANKGYKQFSYGKNSPYWPRTDGEIITSEEKYTSDSRGRGHYYSEIIFEYVVDGITYTSNKVDFSDFKSTRFVKEYPRGRRVTVYYNPSNPNIAVLKPGFSSKGHFLFIAFAIFFFLFGIGSICLGIKYQTANE